LNADQRASLERTFACCNQMVLLLNDILDTTRLETGKLSIDPRMSSLLAVADQALAHCAQAASRREVKLELKTERSADLAFFDSERILQVLTNLLQNAIKYSHRGGLVTLRLSGPTNGADEVRVSVEDQGVGIPLDAQPRVFERLYQVKASDTTIHGGLGIGLYLCRELVRLHGHEIELQSTPGRGSVFAFHLAQAPKHK